MVILFCNDLWEHVYYLNYNNDNVKYIDNFKEIVDFGMFNTIYNEIFGYFFKKDSNYVDTNKKVVL